MEWEILNSVSSGFEFQVSGFKFRTLRVLPLNMKPETMNLKPSVA
ncbi:hypothetical protein COMA2_10125 [Candidatus Nitrospira nitrificans]|uniref:Uncharacterized protein n=1 Tax=Candidatus Nitrospira nitrificans TaxID=1742973 RepID=A0A0S4L6F5_9BACT|nr:hypothetical protein COMA2_10125 [Candidatus Nitrospira nitrificans]